MEGRTVHYELHLRRRLDDAWKLEETSGDAEELAHAAAAAMAGRRCAAASVRRETYDPQAQVFRSAVVWEQSLKSTSPRHRRTVASAAATPLCHAPQDLYTAHARARIAGLLEPVMRREQVTAWELLHRPDLAEALEASGVEVQGAVQRAAVAQAQEGGGSTHDRVRALQRLADKTLERLIRDGRQGRFPRIDATTFAEAAARAGDDADSAYRLGGGVAAHLGGASGWRGKTERLTGLLAALPPEGPARARACRVLEAPLAEMLGGAAPLSVLAGAELDLGGQLAVLVRIAARREADALARLDAEIARTVPPLHGPAAQLAVWLEDPAFEAVRAALAKRITDELRGSRRLRPGDTDGEITVLRALAAVLTAAVGRLLPREEVQAAFVERSKRLVAADFVTPHLAGRGGTASEVRALVRLCGNLTGQINQRDGARWLLSVLQSLRFEAEVRESPDSPGARLSALASLQASLAGAGLPEAELAAARERIGEAGAWVDEQVQVVAGLARSQAAVLTRLAALMRLASGGAAPDGPVTRRAHAEALRLARTPELRAELTARPEALALLRRLSDSRGGDSRAGEPRETASARA